MAPSLEIVKATKKHAKEIAKTMRASDVEHLHKAGFMSAFEGLVRSLEVSDTAFTVLIDGKPASMGGFGFSNAMTGKTTPWLISNELVYKKPIAYARACQALVKYMRCKYITARLTAPAWSENDLRFAEFLGFTVKEHDGGLHTIEMRGEV